MLIEMSGMELYGEKYHHNAKQSSHKFTVWQPGQGTLRTGAAH